MAVQIQRRDFILTLSGAAAWPLVARAQQPDRLSRIIVLMGIANDLEGQERVAAFRQGLQAAGWTEGSNVKIDYHWVGGDADRARTYAAEVVRLKPNVILANGNAVVAASAKGCWKRAGLTVATYKSIIDGVQANPRALVATRQNWLRLGRTSSLPLAA